MSALVKDGIEWWARVQPDKTAVSWEGRTLSYAELDGWAGRIAAQMRDRGVAAGDRVAIVAANSLTYCATAVAVLKLGAVLVPMSTRLTKGEFGVLTASSEPVLVVADEAHAAKVAEADPELTIVDIDELTPLREGEPVELGRVEVDPAEPTVLIYTSGTTGTPKGVIFTNATILGFVSEWGMTEPAFTHDMRLLMVLPLGSAPGLLWGVLHTLVRGGTLHLTTSFRPVQAIETIVAEKVNAMVGVPALYEQIALQESFADADLSSLQTVHVGGARATDKLLKAWADKDVLLRQIYGLTEGGGSVTATPHSEALTKPDRCGRGNVFTRLRVVRDDGSDCDVDEPGEILVRGPSITTGYWRNEEETAQAIRDGWLHTGDLGALDASGSLKMVDRLKDLIISGGLNISPTEIENVIDRLEQVAEVAVIPAEDERFGETPAAVVRLDGELDTEAIIAHCNEHLADFKVPRYVIVVDEPLPRMASGKVAKRELRAAHADIHEQHEKVR